MDGSGLAFRIPVDGIDIDAASGRDRVVLNGAQVAVIYDLEARSWRLLEAHDGVVHPGDRVWRDKYGTWVTGTLAEWRKRPKQARRYRLLELPAVPTVPSRATLLPRLLHHIWSYDFLRTPRPWKTCEENTAGAAAYSPEVASYILCTLALTSPDAFNDVLARCRPDYFGLEARLMETYRLTMRTPIELRYWYPTYLEQMHAALAHYLPFAAGPLKVKLGAAGNWMREQL